MAGLLVGGTRALPLEVHLDAVVVGAAGDPEPVQALDDVDRDRPHPCVHPIDAELPRRPNDPVDAVLQDDDEGVRHAEVRVLAHAGDEEQLVAAVVQVEVVPVVEVPVARAHVAHRLGDLVDGIVIEWRQHGSLSSAGLPAAGTTR